MHAFALKITLYALVEFPTGLALPIEKKSRQMEISLYCFALAIESFFSCLTEDWYLPQSENFKRSDVVVFSLSKTIIMLCYAYAQERKVFGSKYLNVLGWIHCKNSSKLVLLLIIGERFRCLLLKLLSKWLPGSCIMYHYHNSCSIVSTTDVGLIYSLFISNFSCLKKKSEPHFFLMSSS